MTIPLQPASSELPARTLPPIAPRVTGRPVLAAMVGPIVARAVRGAATAAIAVALLWAALAGQGLATGSRIADWTIGLAVVALPLLGIYAVASLVSAALVHALRRLARSNRGGAARVATAGIAAARLIGRPWLSVGVGLALLVWGSTEDGPLAPYRFMFFAEIPVVAGAVVGLLLGVASAVAGRNPTTGAARVAVTATVIPAMLLAGGVAAWAILPGGGDPLVRENPAALAAIEPLELADPSRPGPYTPVAISYGSGSDPRRPEYAAGAVWRTQPVDASAALLARSGVAAFYADAVWGHDARSLPLNGLAWYPTDASGRLPLVLIAHGNHTAGDFSDPGYAYLGEHLASRGMIVVAVDGNYLNGDPFFDYGGSEMAARAWLVLAHLELFRGWDSEPDHPLAGRVDLDRVALIGHSRGGEAAALAVDLESATDGRVPGLGPVARGFGIRTVIAIAPSDGMYTGARAPIRLRNVDYLVIQGAHDGDLPSFDGLRTYHRVEFTGGDHLKAAVYTQRANHGRFNTVWDTGDAGPLVSWLLDRGSLLSPAEQQHLAKSLIGAFLARSLQGAIGYDAFFREPRAGRAWLPDDVVLTHWASSRRVVVDDFQTIREDPAKPVATGFDQLTYLDPPLRNGGRQSDRVARLDWTGAASLALSVTPDQAATIDPRGSLVMALVAADEETVPDPAVELELVNGRRVSVHLGDVAPPRPLFATRLWKAEALGARYLPGEALHSPSELFPQTYELPLTAFGPGAWDPTEVRGVTIRLDGAGSLFLDDVGFEPAVD